MSFVPATREKAKLKMCIAGPSGGGKSYSSLRLAHAMVDAGLGSRIAVIESEAGKIKKYAGYVVDGRKWSFDVCVLDSFSPQEYVAKLELAHRSGYDIVIIDSISHEWQGKGGALELVDKVGGKNQFGGWKTVTPMHNTFIDTVLRLPIHVIATCRSKMGYILEEQTKDGRTIQVPKKIGMEPVQRGGVEYEFEIFCEIDQSHILRVAKTICPLIDGKTVVEPGPDFWQPVFKWLDEGVEVVDNGYRSAMVSSDRLQSLITKLHENGIDIDREMTWILTKFGASEWAHLTPTQFEQYEQRAAVVIAAATEAKQRVNGVPPTSSTTTPPVTNPPTPVEPVNDSPAGNDAKPVNESPAHDAKGQDAPSSQPQTATTQPTVNLTDYVRPANLDPTHQGACAALFEEYAHLERLDNDTKNATLKKIIAKLNPEAKSLKQLSDDQARSLEQKLVTNIKKIYGERGMSSACPF